MKNTKFYFSKCPNECIEFVHSEILKTKSIIEVHKNFQKNISWFIAELLKIQRSDKCYSLLLKNLFLYCIFSGKEQLNSFIEQSSEVFTDKEEKTFNMLKKTQVDNEKLINILKTIAENEQVVIVNINEILKTIHKYLDSYITYRVLTLLHPSRNQKSVNILDDFLKKTFAFEKQKNIKNPTKKTRKSIIHNDGELLLDFSEIDQIRELEEFNMRNYFRSQAGFNRKEIDKEDFSILFKQIYFKPDTSNYKASIVVFPLVIFIKSLVNEELLDKEEYSLDKKQPYRNYNDYCNQTIRNLIE